MDGVGDLNMKTTDIIAKKVSLCYIDSANNRNMDFEYILRILQRRIEERCGAVIADRKTDMTIRLGIDANIGEEGFRIEDGGNNIIQVTGNDKMGLIYGTGKFLHTSKYLNEGLIPSNWRGTSIPYGKIRGMYFATHFFNWYHVAPKNEFVRYIEDLVLWGVNALMLVFPIINLHGWDDEETDKCFVQIRSMFVVAKKLGVKVGFLIPPNQDFKIPVPEFKAVPNPDPLERRGNHGNNICPAKPGAENYIINNVEEAIRRLEGVEPDFLCMWPYDEGGCACENCFPWGANGYLKISKKVVETTRKYYPDIKTIISTWMFDTPNEKEWEGLSKELEQGNNWADFILADAHGDFPKFPLINRVPGGLPLLNFPEISMWGLYPWGGYGATPLPHRFERLWNQVGTIVKGGFPYSEGIYEDINKVVISQFYWNSLKTADESLREYISYEFSNYVIDDVLKMISLIEKNHIKVAEGEKADLNDAVTAYHLAIKADEKLPEWAKKSWRWRILFIRTILDCERYGKVSDNEWPWPDLKSWGELLENNKLAENAMNGIRKYPMKQKLTTALQKFFICSPFS